MKISKKSFNAMQTVGGIVGGMAAKLVENYTADSTSDNNYMTIGVQAVGGALINAFVSNDLMKGVGSGMIGVAGWNLAKELGLGEETKTSGLGNLPSQNAVGRLPYRRSIPSRIRGIEEEKSAVANVQ